MRRILAAAGVAAGLLAPAAGAQTTQTSYVEEAVRALRDAPVYVASDADPRLTEREVDDVRRAIARHDAGPVYVAVLPERARDQAGGSTSELLREIAESLRRRGTYVVVAGRQLRAASTLLPAGRAGDLAARAVAERRGDGLGAILVDFVRRLGDARGSGAQDRGNGRGGGGFVPLLVLLGAGGGLFGFFRMRRRRRERAEAEEVREVARDDVVRLGDDIRELDLDVEMPGADAAARADYARGLDAYERANAALARVRRPQDLAAVSEAVEEGRFALASAKARLEGRPVPERRPPCFFDPRHGPSVRDVDWAPPGGAPRPVPACAADALAVEEGRDPATREIEVGGRSMPYYEAPGAYAPWAGGFFGGFGGGFLPGLLFGSMLGWGPGLFHGGEAHGGEGGFGGGDFGGGDFGGGDFGGGDFGGGGGDFGGGDF